MLPFSEREGHAREAAIVVREDAPPELRDYVLLVVKSELEFSWLFLRDTVRLTKDWYQQICRLVIPSNSGRIDTSTTRLEAVAYEYVHNRLVLPELILCLDILKKHRRARQLVYSTSAFLDVVTAYEEEKKISNRSCRGCSNWNVLIARNGGNARNLLSKLDHHLQRIAHEAAALL